MPTLLTADRVLVTINGTLFGQRIMSTFGYVVESQTGSNQDDDAFTALRNKLCELGGLVDKYLACLPSQYVKGQIWIQDIQPTRIVKRVFTNIAAGATSGEVAETANIAGTILRRGDFANRRNVSVLHLPSPTTVNWIDQGNFTVQALTAYQALADKIILDQATTVPVVNYAPSILPKTAAGLPVPITSANAQDIVRTMHRRTVGLGI